MANFYTFGVLGVREGPKTQSDNDMDLLFSKIVWSMHLQTRKEQSFIP